PWSVCTSRRPCSVRFYPDSGSRRNPRLCTLSASADAESFASVFFPKKPPHRKALLERAVNLKEPLANDVANQFDHDDSTVWPILRSATISSRRFVGSSSNAEILRSSGINSAILLRYVRTKSRQSLFV